MNTQNDWKDRYDALTIGHEGVIEPLSESIEDSAIRKDFIRNLLADARKEVGNGIEKMYLSVADEDPRYDTVEEIQAYNQAIYEIVATLKEEGK